MEKMTQKERETLLALQAKAKRVQRAEEAFLREADARKDELLERWGLSDKLQNDATHIEQDMGSMNDNHLGDRFDDPQHQKDASDY